MDTVVHRKSHYIVLKVSNGFIAVNTNKDFEKGHTHLKSFEMAKVLIDCSIKKKFPRTRNPYLLSGLVRISDDEKFIFKINELIETRRNKR